MRETRLKILQYVTGAGLFIIAGYHLWFSQMGGEEATSWESVTERAQSAGWLVFYILFLVFVIYHGLHGLRTIVLELSLPDSAARTLDWVLLAVGLAILGYAAYIPISAF